jgi:hypothetical protein
VTYSDTEDPDPEHDDDFDEGTSAANDHSWSMEEKMELLSQVEKALPKVDVLYWKTINKLNWTKFEVGTHSAEEMKAQVLLLIKPIRKTRNLREVLSDCNVANMRKSYEDMPKQPPRVYNIFLKDKFLKVKAKMEGQKPVKDI